MAEHILYVFSPIANISPFDVNLAVDSGYIHVLPFAAVQPADVVPLVQDAIFCRPAKRHHETGIFIGGRDVNLASDMFASAKKAMVGDFQVGLFADPNGAYTTSAALLALVEKALKKKTNAGFEGRKVAIFGTGPVGLCTSVLAAKEGAQVSLCELIADEDKSGAEKFWKRYNVDVDWVSAKMDSEKIDVVSNAEVVLCVAKAGIRILDAQIMNQAKHLIVAADSNAVPPSGIVGIDAKDDNKTISLNNSDYLGIGSLVIGDLKYKTEKSLFQMMQSEEQLASIDFPEAYQMAALILKKQQEEAKAA